MLTLTFKVSFRSATDFTGARWIVRNLGTGTSQTVSYQYPQNTALEAVRAAFPDLKAGHTLHASGAESYTQYITAVWL